MHILLTAFEPFGGNTTNITQDVIRELPEQIGEHPLHKLVLPVSFQKAPMVLREAIEQLKPNFVLMLGQCKEGDTIRLERYAHNMMDSRLGDNDHYFPTEELIYLDSPTALMTTMVQSPNTLASILKDKGCLVEVSNTAGLYVCNRVYYESLYLKQAALFVHIPKNCPLGIAASAVQQLIAQLTI